MTSIINGNTLAKEIIDVLKEIPTPKKELHAVIVGNDNASLSFLKKKSKIAENIGIKFVLHKLSTSLTQEELINKISEIDNNEYIGGIIVQLPLPKKYDRDIVLGAINVNKDVDALLGENSIVLPPAVGALDYILNKIDFNFENKKIVVIGLGFLVGLPISKWLTKKVSKFTIIDKGQLKEDSLKNSDLIITATGVPELIRGASIKKGATIVDFGYGRKNGKLFGDIEISSVKEKASYFTPTPGGTGPIVVAKLFENFYKLNS